MTSQQTVPQKKLTAWSAYCLYKEQIEGKNVALWAKVIFVLLGAGIFDDVFLFPVGEIDDVVVLPGWTVFILYLLRARSKGKKILRNSDA